MVHDGRRAAYQVTSYKVTELQVTSNLQGALTRKWYTTGGVLLTNGMLVDFGTITCIMQGWNVGVLLL